MVRERRYKRRTSFLMNTDYDVLEDFRKLCSNERKDVSEKLNELTREELQKNVVGVATPINIPYSNDINQSGKITDITCLDYFIEKKLVTFDYWRQEYRNVDSLELVDKYTNLTGVINACGKERKQLIQTGGKRVTVTR